MRPSPAERIGLLGEPSGDLTKAKEAAEASKLKLEEERAKLDLARVRRVQDAERKAEAEKRAAELESRREAEAEEEERRRWEAEQRRRDVEARRQHARRQQWLEAQAELARSSVSAWTVPDGKLEELREAIAAEIPEALAGLSPDSSSYAIEKARAAVIDRTLAPYRLSQIIEKVLPEIGRYLDRLHQEGWNDLCADDRSFLSKRLEPRIRAKLEREGRARPLREEDALRLVRDSIDSEFGLS